MRYSLLAYAMYASLFMPVDMRDIFEKN